jgi:hypothetical protein
MTEPGMQAVELQAEAEDHAKFVAPGAASAYPKSDLFRPGSSFPLNWLKLQNRPSVPTGFTKSSMTVIG